MYRQPDVFGAGPLQFMDTIATIGNHKSATALGGNGIGDFHCPPLNSSAGTHGRKNLEDGN